MAGMVTVPTLTIAASGIYYTGQNLYGLYKLYNEDNSFAKLISNINREVSGNEEKNDLSTYLNRIAQAKIAEKLRFIPNQDQIASKIMEDLKKDDFLIIPQSIILTHEKVAKEHNSYIDYLYSIFVPNLNDFKQQLRYQLETSAEQMNLLEFMSINSKACMLHGYLLNQDNMVVWHSNFSSTDIELCGDYLIEIIGV
jgi:hypothetical protein